MSGGQGADALWYLLALVLVGSALFSRRISFRGALGMAFAWAVLFGLVLFAFMRFWSDGQGEDAAAVDEGSVVAAGSGTERTAKGRADPSEQPPVLGSSLRLPMAADGHFWAEARINGTPVRFLIDSGATVTALSEDVARQAGIAPDTSLAPVEMQTANGVVTAQRASIRSLTLGPISTDDLDVIVSDRLNGINVLGMNFLSRLKSWRVEKNEMLLEP